VSLNDLQSTIVQLRDERIALANQVSGMQASMDDGYGAAMINVQIGATSQAVANG